MGLKLITVGLAVLVCLANARSLEEKKSVNKVARRGLLKNVARDFYDYDKFTKIDAVEVLQCVFEHTYEDYIPGKGYTIVVNMVAMVDECICPRGLYECDDDYDYSFYDSDWSMSESYYPSSMDSWMFESNYPSDWYYSESNYPSSVGTYIDPALDSTYYPSDLTIWDYMKRKQAIAAEKKEAAVKEGRGSGGFGSKEKEDVARREQAQKLRSSNVENVKRILTELKNLQKTRE